MTYRETKEQAEANAFDMKLFRLLQEAHQRTRRTGDAWNQIAAHLADARFKVRMQMHPKRRLETNG